MGRKLLVALISAALVACAAPAAAAAANTLYAAPANQGTHDCSSAANACPISTAVTNANSGDTIDVLGNLGDYNLGSATITPGTTKALHFVGINGRPRLIDNTNGTTLSLEAPSSSATNLYLENDGTGNGLFAGSVSSGSFSVDRVFVKTAGATAQETCFVQGGVTFTNSVCWEANSTVNAAAIFAESTDTLRNDTAWSAGHGAGVACESGASGQCTLTVINTIARSVGPGGHDLVEFASAFPATINISHSNFATTLTGGDMSMDHINTDSTDQSAPPLLVNPAAGDFHELATSPTINAGITDPANRPDDLDGNVRVVNGKTDIGAYERGTPGTTPSIVNLVPPNTRIRKSRIKRHKHRATFTFTSTGTAKSFTTGFQCALVRKKKGKHHKKRKPHFTSCRSPKTYKHLRHGKYTFEVRALDAAGADATPATKTFRI